MEEDVFYIVADTETTGLTSPIGVVELAWVQIDEMLEPICEFSTLVNPGRDIEPKAQEIHGICAENLVNAPELGAALSHLKYVSVVVIGHNIQFDLRLIGQYLNVVGTVCTLSLARQYYPKAPNHRLKTVQEHLGLPDFDAHRALGDVYTSLNILKKTLHDHGLTLPQVVKRQATPRMLLNMPYGKHKGEPISTVPWGYRRWLLDQGNLDPDLQYTLQRLDLL